MESDNEKWISLNEVAEYLGVAKDTIRNWIQKGLIPAHKIDEWVSSGKSAM